MKKFMTIGIGLFLALGLLFGFGALQLSGSDSGMERKVSDHYNGKKYFNPTLDKQFSPGISDIFQMMKEGREEWPENLENKGVPSLNEDLKPDDIALTFVNHASFLIQTADLNILTDPVWSKRASPVSWFGPKRVRKPGVEIDSLPHIDIVLISHNHYDHLDTETLKQLDERFSPKVIVPVGDKDLIKSIGIKNVKELDWWESVQVNSETCITFTPSQHSSARGLFDKDESLWGSFFILHRERSIYFGGDGGYSTHFADIKERLGAPEFAILGIGAYAPRSFMKAIHMDPAEAVIAHKDLGAKQGIGMHFGTFQLSSEAIDQPQRDLAEALEKEMLSQDSFITLQEGETRVYQVAPEIK
ncbi:MBL fold metallo-hydrolase [Fulvivirga ulvae]|uniref:MBL fold metallo-hydrolase n=1 Tax=Fulvivirga ulvae TaxID=2904245 RepID=UPI001F17E8AB|nr:MBL fold metallo-hydrolase [Fulvivirga ulvae]UII29597.1 MBL fold metallo-hydrolase [Fulvivirga ulvae]